MKGRTPKDKAIAVLGYGSQGRATALNLRDSGYDVVIGLRSNSPSRKAARRDGFKQIHTVRKAVRLAQCACFAFPDHLHGRVCERDISGSLNDGATLLFLHGFSVHFGFVVPPERTDVIMIAPHAPGVAVREQFLGDRSLSAFYAIHQDHSGKALKTVLSLANGMGFRKDKLIRTSFEIETVGDLFGEQAVLCGGMAELVQNGFEVLVEKGLPAENAYLEVAYQLDLIIQLIKQHGIAGMYRRISVAARYGSVLSGRKIIDKSVKKRMVELFDFIASGKFARMLNRLDKSDIAALRKTIDSRVDKAFERAARKYAR